MESLISKTGYWNGKDAHIHHAHSEELAKKIIDYLKNDRKTRVWDLGCGMGFYLNELKKAGFKDLVGLEGDIPQKAIFDKILRYDITNPIRSLPKGNVICLEVLEHIPAVFTERVLKNIQYLCSDKLILSWAVRGQAGVGHVNCLNNPEVIDLFEKRGFGLLEKETENFRSVIGNTTPWFKNTLLIFQKLKNENQIQNQIDE